MKVSVIIPVYNTEKYLRKCIDSVLNQTMLDYEIIIVNDGSTDNSVKIVQEYIKKNNNIHLINQKNKGQAAARNAGIKEASGEYLYFLDSDDMIKSNLLKICTEEMDKNKLDIICFGHTYLYEKNFTSNSLCSDEYVNTWIAENEILDGKKFLEREISTKRISPSTCRQMYRRKFVLDNQLFYIEGHFYEDIELFVRGFMKAKRVKNLQRPLYIWRKREESTTANLNIKLLNSLDFIINELFKLFQKGYMNNKNEIITAKRFLLHHLQMLFDKTSIWYEQNKDQEYVLKLFNKKLMEFKHAFKEKIGNNDYCFWAEQISKFSDMLGYKDINGFLTQVDKENYELCIKGIEQVKEIKKSILEEIPFNDKNKTIGIYGIGKHTESLLKYYENNFGTIQSKIIFIDSFKGFNNEKMYERSIINIKEVNNYKFDCICISSFGSEEKMFCNLINILKNKVTIIKIYGNKYDFSLFI